MFHFAAGAGATLGTTLLALHWFRQRNQRSRVLQSQQRPVTTTQQVTLPQTRTQPPSVPPAIPPPLLPPPPPPLAPHTADWFRPIPGVDYSATTFNPYRIRCHGYSDGPDYPFRIYVYDRSKDGGLVRWVNDRCREHTEWRVPEIERKLRELPTEEVDIDGLKLLIKSFINELDPPLSDFAEVGMQGVVETDKVKTKMICWIEARILLRGKIPYNTERLPSTPSPVLQPATPLTLKRPLVDVEEVNEDELRLMQASAIKVEEVKEDRPNLLKASPVVHDDTEEINDTIEVKIGEPARK